MGTADGSANRESAASRDRRRRGARSRCARGRGGCRSRTARPVPWSTPAGCGRLAVPPPRPHGAAPGSAVQHEVVVVAVAAPQLLVCRHRSARRWRSASGSRTACLRRRDLAGRDQRLVNRRVAIGVERELMVQDVAAPASRQVEVAVIGQVDRRRLVARRVVAQHELVAWRERVGDARPPACRDNPLRRRRSCTRRRRRWRRRARTARPATPPCRIPGCRRAGGSRRC